MEQLLEELEGGTENHRLPLNTNLSSLLIVYGSKPQAIQGA